MSPAPPPRKEHAVRYIYEVEFFESGMFTIAAPFGIDFVTQGENLEDAVDMADDLIKSVIEDCLLNNKVIPTPSLGNSAQRGGTVVIMSVVAGLDTLSAVSATEAALQLGLSRSRVSHMLRDGLLEGYRKGRDTFVTVDSLNIRKKERRKVGRPIKELASAQ